MAGQRENLAERPISLEYAARPDGEWLPIQLDMENKGRYSNERVSGDFSWKVPPSTPVQVYLRVRVRDKAGNERIGVTQQPQYVDLTEPERRPIGVQPPPVKGPSPSPQAQVLRTCGVTPQVRSTSPAGLVRYFPPFAQTNFCRTSFAVSGR